MGKVSRTVVFILHVLTRSVTEVSAYRGRGSSGSRYGGAEPEVITKQAWIDW